VPDRFKEELPPFPVETEQVCSFEQNVKESYFDLKNYLRTFFRPREKREARLAGPAESERGHKPGLNQSPSNQIPRCDAIINRSAIRLAEDLKILSVASIADDIVRLKRKLTERNHRFTTWMGDFTSCNEDAEMGKLWENAWILAHSDVGPNARILDAGGASTIFSFYLASKGCEVSVIDSDWLGQGIIENAIAVSRAMNYGMKVISGDITHPLPYPVEYFDYVFCICVMEHLGPGQRRQAMKNLAACLKPGGLMGLTIDYDIERGGDKGLRFRDRDAIVHDLVLPSGLSVYGNDDLIDEYDERYFLGALILKK
jgi:SAM-dependent methyltransferase